MVQDNFLWIEEKSRKECCNNGTAYVLASPNNICYDNRVGFRANVPRSVYHHVLHFDYARLRMCRVVMEG